MEVIIMSFGHGNKWILDFLLFLMVLIPIPLGIYTASYLFMYEGMNVLSTGIVCGYPMLIVFGAIKVILAIPVGIVISYSGIYASKIIK